MNPEGRRFDHSTRGRVVELLRRKAHTVDELGTALELTDNAIRSQLFALERDGVVEQHGLRRSGGKPSVLYGVTAEYEAAQSRAYVPFAVTLLEELASRIAAPRLKSVLRAAGRRWAAGVAPPGGNLAAKARWAAALLAELGGPVDLVEGQRGSVVLEGTSCPLSAVVRSNPSACAAMESLLSDLLAVPVVEQCDRGGARPCCRFLIGRGRQS
jgi:DeoR family suf operon transcriptional repressor